MGTIRKIMGMLDFLVMLVAFVAIQTTAAQEDYQSVLRISDEGQPYLYGSRYQCQLILCESENRTGTQRIYWNAPEIINLICELENGSQSIPVYCMDSVVSKPVPGDTYRRINLEDREEFGGEDGGRLRAVLLGSFPHLSLEEIEKRVNEAMGEGQVRQLTQGEVLSAAQQAIWTIGSGGGYVIDRNYVSIRGMSHYDPAQFVYPESLTACVESPYTWGNIQNLYQYFLEMEPVEPIKEVVSSESIQIIACESAEEPDGSYTVKVIYEIMGMIGDGDELTLIASCADQSHRNELKQGRGSLVFMGLTEIEPISISITGYQCGGDVYLYCAEEGGCDLIGYDESRLPVNVLRTISVEDIKAEQPVTNEITVSQTDAVPIFTVEVDETEAKIRKVFQILGGGFFLTAFMLSVICLLSKSCWHT